MTQPELLKSTSSSKSECYQKIELAIDNFNNDLMHLVESLGQIKTEEFASLANKLEAVGKNIAFINKYFAEVVAKK
ncbi:MAG: hypothetical protein V4612_05785 [Pseudomonadota bacterium]